MSHSHQTPPVDLPYELVSAVINNDFAKIQLLRDQGVDMNILVDDDMVDAHNDLLKFQGLRPLGIAALQGHIESVKALVAAGMDFNTPTPSDEFDESWEGHGVLHLFGSTPLFNACDYGHLEIVKYFISQGADYTNHLSIYGSRPMTPLYIAARNNRVDIVKYLTELGADFKQAMPKVEDEWGNMTPLFVASHEGSAEVVKYLCEQGADVNGVQASGDHQAYRPIHIAIEKSVPISIIESLIAHGAKLNFDMSLFKPAYAPHPLYIAAENANLAATRLVLQQPGLRLANFDTDGESDPILHFAVKQALSYVGLVNIGLGDDRYSCPQYTIVHLLANFDPRQRDVIHQGKSVYDLVANSVWLQDCIKTPLERQVESMLVGFDFDKSIDLLTHFDHLIFFRQQEVLNGALIEKPVQLKSLLFNKLSVLVSLISPNANFSIKYRRELEYVIFKLVSSQRDKTLDRVMQPHHESQMLILAEKIQDAGNAITDLFNASLGIASPKEPHLVLERVTEKGVSSEQKMITLFFEKSLVAHHSKGKRKAMHSPVADSSERESGALDEEEEKQHSAAPTAAKKPKNA